MRIEIQSEAGRELLRRLLAVHPEWASGYQEGQRIEGAERPVYARLIVPSGHPTIRTPLTIELGGTLQLFWHGGYFYDFLGREQAADAFEFLQRFFAEEVSCGLHWHSDRVVSGGPVEDEDLPGWIAAFDRYERTEIRSWRGNRDIVNG